jgi:hypothetical protein
MKISSLVSLSGITCAVVFIICTIIHSYLLTIKIDKLESECRTNPIYSESKFGAKTVCEAATLYELNEYESETLPGIQGQLEKAYRIKAELIEFNTIIIILIFIGSLLPYTFFTIIPKIWYFLLDRLSEVSRAIVKPFL